jgi:hypothetical protein
LDSFSGAGAALRRLHHSCRCFESLRAERFKVTSEVCFRVKLCVF